MANEIGKPNDRPATQDRDGPLPPEHSVDGEKALTAFRDAMAERQRATLDAADLDAAPTPHVPERGAEGLGDSAPDLNSESVAQEFQALTGARQTHALENKPAAERFRLGRRRAGPGFER